MRGHMSDATHFLRRAREEARYAILADEPSVAAAHHGLSVQYAAHARQCLQASGAIEQSAFPQFEEAKADIVGADDLKTRVGKG